MAISVVGTPQAGGVISGGNVTLTFDVVPSTNDVVFVCCHHFGRSGDSALPITAGYTTISDNQTINGVHFVTAYKVMGGSPDTTVTVSGNGNSSDATSACAIVLRGVDTTNVLGATFTVANGSGSPPNPASITTANANSWVIAFTGGTVQDTTPGTISGYSNTVSGNAADTNSSTSALATKLVASPGAEDPAAWSSWTNAPWKTCTIEVREGAAGPTTIEADFDSDGVAVVSSVGSAIAQTSFSPTGVATVNGIAAATVLAAFVSTGQATVSAEGFNAASSGTIHPADATAFGQATVVGVGTPVLATVGATAGVATVNGVSGALAKSDFDADGVAIVNGVGGVLAVTKPFDGNSSGAAAVTGVGVAVRATTYGANGVANVNGISGVLAKSVYGANGVATVNGVGANANAPAAPNNGTRYVINLRRRRRDVSNV